MNSVLLVFIYSIIVYGVSNHIIFAHGPFHIYDKIHEVAARIHPQLDEAISCFICFPTWVGIFASLGNYLLAPTYALTPCMMYLGGILPIWMIIILDGFFASGIAWLINTIQEAIERTNKPNE